MYLLRCLLFSLLILHALGSITIDDGVYKIVTDSFTGPSCACSNFTISEHYKCDDTGKELAKLTPNLDKFCESFGKIIATELAAPKKKSRPAKMIQYFGCQCSFYKRNGTKFLNCSISKEWRKMNPPPEMRKMLNLFCHKMTWADLPQPNKTININETDPDKNKNITEAVPTFLCMKDKKQCFSQKDLDKVTVPSKSIECLGCRCESVELNNMVTLNCTLSNIVLEINPPLETKNMLNSFCQNLTWANIPQPNKTKTKNDTHSIINGNTTEALPTFLCTEDKKKCFSRQDLHNVTIPAKIIENLGCRCDSVELNNTVTLNCSISNKALEINPPLETRKMLNSFCQKLTWAHVPQPINNETKTVITEIEEIKTEAVPKVECTTNQKYCFPLNVLDEMVDAVTRLCVCSNVSVGEVKPECSYRQKLDKIKLKDIDSMCTSVKNLTTQLDIVLRNTSIPKTPPSNNGTNNETHSTEKNKATTNKSDTVPTEKHKNDTVSTENPSTTDIAQVSKPEPYVASPPTEAGSQYSTGTIVGIGLSACVVCILIAIAAKMTYTRYRRQTYVNRA